MECPPARQGDAGGSLFRYRRGDRVRPKRSETKGDTGEKIELVFDGSPTSSIGTVGDESNGAVFVFFDITDGELRF